MENEIIVTIRDNNFFEEDFEIPADIKVLKWIEQIEDYLRHKMNEKQQLILIYNGEPLEENDTLQALGITDGSILEIEWR